MGRKETTEELAESREESLAVDRMDQKFAEYWALDAELQAGEVSMQKDLKGLLVFSGVIGVAMLGAVFMVAAKPLSGEKAKPSSEKGSHSAVCEKTATVQEIKLSGCIKPSLGAGPQ